MRNWLDTMLKFSYLSAYLRTFVCCFLWPGCHAQVTTTKSDHVDVIQVQSEGGEGVEEEVLGPLRVWHIVFLVGLVIVIGVTILCCCVEWRIPRTRQEIEETYRRRQLNQKYLHQLERTPDAILRHNNNTTTTSNSSHNQSEDSTDILRTRQQQRHHHHHHHQHKGSHPQSHSSDADHPHSHDHRSTHYRHHQRSDDDDDDDDGTREGGRERRGVSVTPSSARLARIAKSQILGVQTPFSLSAITAAQKQSQGKRTAGRQPDRVQ